jgi:hypothetical protein
MKESAFSFLKAYLEKEPGAIPIKQLDENTEITPRDVAALVMNGVIYCWCKLVNKDTPINQYTKNIFPAYWGDVEKLVDYMIQEEDRIFRHDEIQDIFQLSRDETFCIMSIIQSQGLFTGFYSLVPSASCKICFHRERSQCKDKPDKPCQLFRHDWRLDLKKEG